MPLSLDALDAHIRLQSVFRVTQTTTHTHNNNIKSRVTIVRQSGCGESCCNQQNSNGSLSCQCHKYINGIMCNIVHGPFLSNQIVKRVPPQILQQIFIVLLQSLHVATFADSYYIEAAVNHDARKIPVHELMTLMCHESEEYFTVPEHTHQDLFFFIVRPRGCNQRNEAWRKY